MGTVRPVGVRSSFCSAGKRVKATTQAMASPAAVHRPISRMGRMRETTSAANPSTAATLEAVTGRNLFARA